MTKAKTYGALLLVGTTAILAGGCGDKTEPVKQDAATQKAEAQYRTSINQLSCSHFG